MAENEDTPDTPTTDATATADPENTSAETTEETEKVPVKLRQNVEVRDVGPCKKHIRVTIDREDIDARLDEKSDRKWIMAGLTELRPGKHFELYVELELWKKYVETLPRERD